MTVVYDTGAGSSPFNVPATLDSSSLLPRICVRERAFSLGPAFPACFARFSCGSLSLHVDSPGNEREGETLRIHLDVALNDAGRAENTRHRQGVGTNDVAVASNIYRKIVC